MRHPHLRLQTILDVSGRRRGVHEHLACLPSRRRHIHELQFLPSRYWCLRNATCPGLVRHIRRLVFPMPLAPILPTIPTILCRPTLSAMLAIRFRRVVITIRVLCSGGLRLIRQNSRSFGQLIIVKQEFADCRRLRQNHVHPIEHRTASKLQRRRGRHGKWPVRDALPTMQQRRNDVLSQQCTVTFLHKQNPLQIMVQ